MKVRSISFVKPAMLLACGLLYAHVSFAATTTICSKYDSVSIRPDSNIYKVQNNIWNDIDGSQCLDVNELTGNFVVSSSTHSKPTNGAPAAYASTYKGCHWGNCTSDTTSGMPIQLSNVLRATSSWKTVQTTGVDIYNASYDIWLNTTPTASGQPDGAEIMIWLNKEGAIQPTGSPVASDVILDGAKWQVWKGVNNGIPVVSYVRNVGTTVARNLNLKSFFGDAKTRGYINYNLYLVSVQAGFEIWEGGEGLVSNSFSVLVE